MNLQYIKYALEISRTGSISKAADNLSVAQPNLSRAVKELESSLGIAIFDRTRTGMTVTPEGEQLLSAGERILRDVGELETMFKGDALPRHSLSVTVARSAYLSHAFVSFCASLPDDRRFDISYREASLLDTLDEVCRGTCKLGIIRIPLHFERYYTEKLTQRELKWEIVADFSPCILAGLGSPLAGKETVAPTDLADLCALHSPDSLDCEVCKTDVTGRKEITATEQATLYALLAADSTTYLCTAPMPSFMAAKYGLIQRPLSDGTIYRDLLITQKTYHPSETDLAFLRSLKETARAAME